MSVTNTVCQAEGCGESREHPMHHGPDKDHDYVERGPELRRFVLRRLEDVTGISGTGVVAQGVEFSDGVVVLRWTSATPTSVVFHDKGMESVEAVHGHGGKTAIEWLDALAKREGKDG